MDRKSGPFIRVVPWLSGQNKGWTLYPAMMLWMGSWYGGIAMVDPIVRTPRLLIVS